MNSQPIIRQSDRGTCTLTRDWQESCSASLEITCLLPSLTFCFWWSHSLFDRHSLGRRRRKAKGTNFGESCQSWSWVTIRLCQETLERHRQLEVHHQTHLMQRYLHLRFSKLTVLTLEQRILRDILSLLMSLDHLLDNSSLIDIISSMHLEVLTSKVVMNIFRNYTGKETLISLEMTLTARENLVIIV